MQDKIINSRLKCPKCKNTTLIIIEYAAHQLEHYQKNGTINTNDNIQNPGSTFKLTSKCNNCNYKWTVRGVTDIFDLEKK